MNFLMKNMKNTYSDPDPLLRKGGSEDPDPLFPNVDPRIRIRIHVKMRWILNAVDINWLRLDKESYDLELFLTAKAIACHITLILPDKNSLYLVLCLIYVESCFKLCIAHPQPTPNGSTIIMLHYYYYYYYTTTTTTI